MRKIPSMKYQTENWVNKDTTVPNFIEIGWLKSFFFLFFHIAPNFDKYQNGSKYVCSLITVVTGDMEKLAEKAWRLLT